MTFLLYDPGWYVHKPDIQNKWDDNSHTHKISEECHLFGPCLQFILYHTFGTAGGVRDRTAPGSGIYSFLGVKN